MITPEAVFYFRALIIQREPRSFLCTKAIEALPGDSVQAIYKNASSAIISCLRMQYLDNDPTIEDLAMYEVTYEVFNPFV
jgi:hypothetical protein